MRHALRAACLVLPLLSLPLLALTALPAAARAGTVAPAAEAPRWSGPVAETATSRIFAPIVLAGTAEDRALQAAGYVQEEYFLSGRANLYGEQADGALFVRAAGVPYATRLVIVRPRDPARFNGIVHLAFQHPNLAGTQWGRIDSLVLRSGAAYAVVVNGADLPSRAQSSAALPMATPWLFQWYDGARYAALDLPIDDGVRWDIMGQAAGLLRDPGGTGPLAGWTVRHVYGSGWSFLGSTWRSWINYGFHDRFRRADGSPVIDGYLIGISAGSVPAGAVPLNATDPVRNRSRDLLRPIDRPVIELTSEMEAITNVSPQRGDVDTVAGGHRIYELGGVSHGDSGVAGQIRPATVQLRERGHGAVDAAVTCAVGDSDVPMRDVAQAALVNIDRWVETGQAPPRAPRLRVAADGKDYVRDLFGNPLGGVRAAQLDVPLVRYAEPGAALCGGKVPRRAFKRLPVGAAVLRGAYPGGAREYLRKFDARLAALVKAGWLLAPDAAAQARAARANAAAAFGAPR